MVSRTMPLGQRETMSFDGADNMVSKTTFNVLPLKPSDGPSLRLGDGLGKGVLGINVPGR